MCFTDCEQPKVAERTLPHARKQYTCCECGSTIDPGEQHECIKGIWDDTWETYRTCMVCAKIRDAAMYDKPHDECIMFGGLYDCVGYDYEEAAKCQQ